MRVIIFYFELIFLAFVHALFLGRYRCVSIARAFWGFAERYDFFDANKSVSVSDDYRFLGYRLRFLCVDDFLI